MEKLVIIESPYAGEIDRNIMRGLPDKYFNLALCDPPYGIDINFNMVFVL